MVRLIVAAILTFVLSIYAAGNAAGAANVGNGQGKQFNTGACVSDADCKWGCAGLKDAAFDQGKRGCGFRGASAGGTGGIGGQKGRNSQNDGNNGRTGDIGGVGGVGGNGGVGGEGSQTGGQEGGSLGGQGDGGLDFQDDGDLGFKRNFARKFFA